MPQENSVNTAAEVRQLFTDVLKENEQLKVRVGQTVVLNDSDVGKPQDRLDAGMLSILRESVFLDEGDRVDIPTTPTGKNKAAEIEVVGVSGKGPEGERLLFRQEKGLSISVNEVGDRARERADNKAQNNPLETTQTAQEPESPTTLASDKSTAIVLFEQKTNKLPQSNTKALWKQISNDFKTLGQQLKGIGQKGKEIASAAKKAPEAVKQDAAALADRTKQQISDAKQSVQTKLSDAKQSVQTRIAQTSVDDVASAAIKGASAVAEAGSKGLGIANLYLKSRADKVKSYGMAKAALRLYEKGHARTGESIFTANNYTVEAVTDGFRVTNAQGRSLMSFGTDEKGKPISVTKEAALQPEDYRQLNQASKLPVIEGSLAAEAAYAQRISQITEGLKDIVAEGDTLSGHNFYISRENPQAIALTTQGFPRREMTVDLANGTQTSTLTIADLEQVEANIEASASIEQSYAAQLEASESKEPAQVEMA